MVWVGRGRGGALSTIPTRLDGRNGSTGSSRARPMAGNLLLNRHWHDRAGRPSSRRFESVQRMTMCFWRARFGYGGPTASSTPRHRHGPRISAYQFPMLGFTSLNYPWTIHSMHLSKGSRLQLVRRQSWRNPADARWRDHVGGSGSVEDAARAPVNSLAFDPSNPNVLYAALSNFDDATPETRPVFKTTNDGGDAVPGPTSARPSNASHSTLAVDREIRNSCMRERHRAVARIDAGASWFRDGVTTGLPNASVYDIQINPATDRTAVFGRPRAFACDVAVHLQPQCDQPPSGRRGTATA